MEKKELSLQLNNINIGDFKMKKTNFAVAGLSLYSISGIKYLVTYYDRSGNFMAEDDGRVSRTLNPSEKYNFTFWSSNAKYPTTANLRLDFSDKTVLELMKEKTYTGKEFLDFINT